MSDHLRGRVYPMRVGGRIQRANGKIVWRFDVVNTVTGKVVHTDNTCGLSRVCDGALENVETLRTVWTMGVKTRDLSTRK